MTEMCRYIPEAVHVSPFAIVDRVIGG